MWKRQAVTYKVWSWRLFEREREREREREETIEIQSNSNYIYVHDYCSNNAILHNFNLIDVDDFGA